MRRINGMKTMAAAAAAVLMLAACGEKEPAPVAEPTKAETQQPETKPGEDAKPTEAATTDPGQEEDHGQEAATAQMIYDQITTALAMPDMYIADDDWIMNKYGLDAADLESYVCAEGDETHVDRVFIVKPKAGADTEAIKAKVGSELAQLSTEDMMDYMDKAVPGQSEYVKAAAVKEQGGFIYLFISPEASAMEEILKSAVE